MRRPQSERQAGAIAGPPPLQLVFFSKRARAGGKLNDFRGDGFLANQPFFGLQGGEAGWLGSDALQPGFLPVAAMEPRKTRTRSATGTPGHERAAVKQEFPIRK